MSAVLPDQPGPLTVAIIGAGKAGRSLAAEAVRAGHRVVLEDVLPSRLRTALEEIPTGNMPGSLEFAAEVESAVREADIAIDFVPDELESKLEIISLIDRMAPPKTIVCMPTRTLEADDLSACTYRSDRFVTVQDNGEAVILSATAQTSQTSLHVTEVFWRSIGRGIEVLSSSELPARAL